MTDNSVTTLWWFVECSPSVTLNIRVNRSTARWPVNFKFNYDQSGREHVGSIQWLTCSFDLVSWLPYLHHEIIHSSNMHNSRNSPSHHVSTNLQWNDMCASTWLAKNGHTTLVTLRSNNVLKAILYIPWIGSILIHTCMLLSFPRWSRVFKTKKDFKLWFMIPLPSRNLDKRPWRSWSLDQN